MLSYWLNLAFILVIFSCIIITTQANNCPICHILNSKGDCVQIPKYTDPNNDCPIYCGVKMVCGELPHCIFSTVPSCDCDWNTGICEDINTNKNNNDQYVKDYNNNKYNPKSTNTNVDDINCSENPGHPMCIPKIPNNFQVNDNQSNSEDMQNKDSNNQINNSNGIIILLSILIALLIILILLIRNKKNLEKVKKKNNSEIFLGDSNNNTNDVSNSKTNNIINQ